MKILFVTDLIPIDEDEQCSLALFDFVKGFMDKGVEVDVIRPNFLLNSRLRNKVIKPSGKIEFRGIKIWNLNFKLPFMLPFENFDTSRYDAVVAHMPSGILFCETLKISDKVNKIYAVHQSDIEVLTNPIYSVYFRNKLKTAYWNCEKIIARSPHLKKKLAKLMPGIEHKISVVPSGVPSQDIVSAEFIGTKFAPPLKFVTAANLIKRKNIDLVLKSLAKFRDKDFSFTIAGDGVEKENLEKLVEKLKLANKVKFVGKLSHDELLKLFKESDIFILPSVKETLGLVYLEAMASGCLCIAALNTGVDGIINDGYNGYLVNPRRAKLVKKLRLLFESDAFRLKRIASKSLQTINSLTQEKMVERYLSEISC